MKGLTSTKQINNRSKSTCSYCRNPEHQVSKCPHIPIIKKSLDKGVIPLAYMRSVAPNDQSAAQTSSWRLRNDYWVSPLSTYFTQGEYWGELYKQTDKAHNKWLKAQQRAKAKKTKRAKTVRNCGFCGGNHTRRTCGHLASYETKLIRANRNFRQKFYEEFVEQKGLSTGAIVDIEVAVETGHREPNRTETVRTIVTEINWDSINLFACKEDVHTGWSAMSSYQGTGGQEKLNNIQEFVRSGVYLKVAKSTLEAKGVPCPDGYYDNGNDPYRAIPLETFSPLAFASNCSICTWTDRLKPYRTPEVQSVTVISRAPQVLADDWVDGYSDEMSIIFKKFTKAQLDFLGITSHIDEWANI
jgi:hypothetical protein